MSAGELAAPPASLIYAADAAEAIVLATGKYDGDQPVNIGAGFEITIKDLVEKIVKLTGFNGEIRWDATKPDGQPRRCLDTSRAKEYFGFEAATDFERGLQETIRWTNNIRVISCSFVVQVFFSLTADI